MKLVTGTSDSFILEPAPRGIISGVAARKASTADYDAPLSEIRRQEKALLHSITGLEKKNILFLNQVHGDTILTVSSQPGSDEPFHGDADAMITDTKGICLVIRTADCVPVIIFDDKQLALGAVHSGWKGTQLDITGKTVDLMKEVYSSRPENLKIWIYPSIGPESYEVNEDVARWFPDERIDQDERIFVDLWQSIETSLINRGISKKNIYNEKICNRQNTSDFFSHRFGDAGRNLNFAFLE